MVVLVSNIDIGSGMPTSLRSGWAAAICLVGLTMYQARVVVGWVKV